MPPQPSDKPTPGRFGPIVGLLAVVVFIGLVIAAYSRIEPPAQETKPTDQTVD